MVAFLRKIGNDARSFPAGVKLVVFVLFLRSFGWGFVDPFFSIFVNGFTENYAQTGAYISLLNLTSLITLIPLMRLLDKVQDTAIMRDGEVLYFFAILFYLLAANTGRLSFLLVAFVLNGIAFPFVVVAAEAYIRKHGKPANETKSFAFYTALHYLGWTLGMVLASYVFYLYGLKWMFLFVLPGVLAGFFMLRRIHEHGLKHLFQGFRKYFHNGHDFQIMFKDIGELDRHTIFFLFLAFFDGVIVMFSFIFIPLFARSIDLSMPRIALLMAVMYMPFVFSFVISEAMDRWRRMDVIAFGLLIGGFSFVFLSFILHEMLITIMATMKSVSLAILRPAYSGMITHLTPRRMLGEVTSLSNISMRLGFIVGPIISGIMADQYGLQLAFFAIAVSAFVLAIISLIFRGFDKLPENV